MKIFKNILMLLIIGLAVYFYVQQGDQPPGEETHRHEGVNREILEAVHGQLSNRWVSGEGRVSRILSDDNYGDRHQRFIIRLSPEHTVLIAHNIDLAPRINKLKRGDIVGFYGEYEWNSKGGVVHWTHRDPKGRRKGGWLKHNGRLYK
ncbi:MAG: DUF3465 domain-containing protein [Acidobacteriota bacterium]